MITKRIIPCLDVKNGRVVKGVNFEGSAVIQTNHAVTFRKDRACNASFFTADNQKDRELKGTVTKDVIGSLVCANDIVSFFLKKLSG